MPTVSIIIPSWNSAEKLTKNLQASIDAIKDYPGSEVIVVDDASSDNSVEVVEQFPQVKLIKRQKNGGFSSTVNQGVREAKGEFVVQINSDARPDKDFLKYALPHFENPQVFSVNCNAGGVWNTAGFKNGFIWHRQAPNADPTTSHQTLWSSGGSGVFRRDLWQKMGGLDELFNPFYEEDMDLGYRATKRGYINIWEPKSKVEHYKEKGVIATHFSSARVARVAQRNQLLFMWKNITDSGMMFSHIFALIKMLIVHPKYWGVFLAALWRLPKLWPKRKQEQKHAHLTDKQVLEMLS